MLVLILQHLYTDEPILLTFLQCGCPTLGSFLPLFLLMKGVLEAVFFLAAGRLQHFFSFPFFVFPSEKYTCVSVVCSNSQKLLMVTVASLASTEIMNLMTNSKYLYCVKPLSDMRLYFGWHCWCLLRVVNETHCTSGSWVRRLPYHVVHLFLSPEYECACTYCFIILWLLWAKTLKSVHHELDCCSLCTGQCESLLKNMQM